MKKLQEIEARKQEIRAMLESDQEVKLEELEAELRELDEEKSKIEKRQAIAQMIEEGKIETRKVEENVHMEINDTQVKETRAKRGQALKVTVGSSDVVLPKHSAADIKPTFNEVSSLIDRVNVKPLNGGEAFEQPYLKGYGQGDHVLEGADYATAEPVFGKAAIAKSKVTAYAEDSEETLKLPAADYDAVVVNNMTVATRKKLTKEILVGTGATNRLVGIFSSAATAIDPATDLTVSAIDEATLDNIVYTFGGDEDVEDTAVLILNKKDLKAFATLRNADGKKVYDVVNNGNTGTIDGVPYVINSGVCN